MLKILQARLQQYMNCDFPDVQLVLEKAEEPEIKLPASAGSSKKQESSKIMASSPITSWQIDGETMERVADLIFLGQQSLQMLTAAIKLKDTPSKESYD